MDRFTKPLSTFRILIIGLVAVIAVLGVALIILVIGHAGTQVDLETVDVLANNSDDCVTCHREESPGIVNQFSHSAMAAAEVTCRDCHEVKADYPGALEHEGAYVLPAYVAVAGSKDLSSTLLAMYQAIPEGSFAPDKARNAIAALEGSAITPFACDNCHSIGVPAADGSVGRCQKCHIRHEFSLEQARKPETCNNCHIGPDHPQWEIYQESPHGILYATSGSRWNWDAEAGNLTVTDFPAPTCALCHMSGFGASSTTHDVGDRLSWFLFASISQQRPDWQENRTRMQNVCFECHNQTFIDTMYTGADAATQQVISWVQESNDLVAPLQKQGLINTANFDEPIDFTFFNLWHYWGRTTKFGVWMQGPDYSQWHGAYPLMETMADLREMVKAKLQAAGATP
jgi:hydroxylamine dehydrogenase